MLEMQFFRSRRHTPTNSFLGWSTRFLPWYSRRYFQETTPTPIPFSYWARSPAIVSHAANSPPEENRISAPTFSRRARYRVLSLCVRVFKLGIPCVPSGPRWPAGSTMIHSAVDDNLFTISARSRIDGPVTRFRFVRIVRPSPRGVHTFDFTGR